MNYCFLKPTLKSERKKNLAYYRAQAVRRLNATSPKNDEEQYYIDTRNLWKGSTKAQQKQYEAIKHSDLLDKNRKMTFIRFNYRHSEEKNLCFQDAYQKQVKNPKTKIFYCIKKANKQKENQMYSEISEQVRNNSLKPQTSWLEEFHETRKERDEGWIHRKIPAPGTMNVSELWGDRQLQESLGWPPCKRDRPKLLKLYTTSSVKTKFNKASVRCVTDN